MASFRAFFLTSPTPTHIPPIPTPNNHTVLQFTSQGNESDAPQNKKMKLETALDGGTGTVATTAGEGEEQQRAKIHYDDLRRIKVIYKKMMTRNLY